MSNFINTSDAIGDEVLIGQIIDRSVTEYKDDTITSIGINAFYQCKSLATVGIPEVTSIAAGGFRGCGSLKTLELPKCTSFSDSSFHSSGITYLDAPVVTSIASGIFDWSDLTTLILRGKIVCTLGGVISNCNIAKGTGYIYVPSALIDSYKAATNWSTHAAQFRALEDYTVDGTITGELDETKI